MAVAQLGRIHFEHPTGFSRPHLRWWVKAPGQVPHFTKQLDYEIEVGIIIGREAFRVSKEEALDYGPA
jgi:2-keto-4-pentenoate hydratase/2-oxohepta-3-ene-1,7-dioic acid hydratase in catechol pathway